MRIKLLKETLYNVGLHFYGTSAGQVGITRSILKGALATESGYYFADGLVGDASVRMLLDRVFDADGIGVEGGAYARSAAERIVDLAAFLKAIGVETNGSRIAQI